MTTAWTWLSARPNGVLAALTALQSPDGADAVDREETRTPFEIPTTIRCVVLVMELALVGGGAFMLLLTGSVIGAVMRSLLHVLLTAVGANHVPMDAVSQICEVATFGWGFVTFMSWFFHQPKQLLVRRLARFDWSVVKTCTVSVVLHMVAMMALRLWQQQTEVHVLVSWRNVETAIHQPDGSLAIAKILQTLLLAPIKEELFFRGGIVLVALNRLQRVKWSAAISSLLFAAIHVANARHVGTQYSMSYVTFQVLWASVVGLFLALKLALSGSLMQCLMLHIINNTFALSLSKTIIMDHTDPVYYVSVLVALTIYAVAIARQLQLLHHSKMRARKAT